VFENSITVVGNVGVEPVLRRSERGGQYTRFRVASSSRQRDRVTGAWYDGPTSWWEVTCWGALAANAAESLRKGERVVVVGRVRSSSWEKEGRTGVSMDITADALGHDLKWGASRFTRVARSEPADQFEGRPGTEGEDAPQGEPAAEAELGIDADGVLVG
jgi:single-strand DNA-binding protein